MYNFDARIFCFRSLFKLQDINLSEAKSLSCLFELSRSSMFRLEEVTLTSDS